MQRNMEQRYAIKFCVKLKKTKQEAYGMLKEAYGDEQMSQASFYRWFNRFADGNEQVEDEPRSGTPKSVHKEENIEELQRLVMPDRRVSVRMLSEAAGISIGTVETVLTEEEWRSGQWWFHQDNAPCHKSTLVTTWMADRGMKVVQHPPYSPDLAPCDFFLFPRMKDSLRGTRFQSKEELKEASESYLKGLQKKDFEEVFQNWERRMQKYVAVRGNYFEVDKVV